MMRKNVSQRHKFSFALIPSTQIPSSRFFFREDFKRFAKLTFQILLPFFFYNFSNIHSEEKNDDDQKLIELYKYEKRKERKYLNIL